MDFTGSGTNDPKISIVIYALWRANLIGLFPEPLIQTVAVSTDYTEI